MNNRNRLTTYILIALVLGIVVGYLVNANVDAAQAKSFSDAMSLITTPGQFYGAFAARMVQLVRGAQQREHLRGR